MAVMAEQPHLDAMALDPKAHVALPVDAHPLAEVNGASTESLTSVAPTTNGNHTAPAAGESLTDASKSDVAMAEHESPKALPLTTFAGETDATLNNHSDPTSTSPPHTNTAPPPIEQPTSDIRDEALPAAPSTLENTAAGTRQDQVMEDAQSAPGDRAADGAGDVEMGEASPAAAPDAAPAAASGHEDLAMRPATEAEDPMEASKLDEQKPIPSVETAEQPDAAAAGQVRQRDADDDGEPERKRTKLSDEPSPLQDATESSNFKVPETPASAAVGTPAAVPATSNGVAAATTVEIPGSLEAKNYDAGPLSDAQKKYLSDALRKLKKTKASLAFLLPVDIVALKIPTYPQFVTNPMDLSTVEEKLKNDQYSSANAVMADMDLIVRNSATFNGVAHAVTQAGYNMLAYFRKLMLSLPRAGQVVEAKKKQPPPAPKPPVRRESRAVVAKSPTVKADATPYALDPNGMPQIRRDSSSMNDRPKREIHPPKNREMPYTVRPKKKKTVADFKFCESVLSELTKKKNAAINYPFLHPVDPVALNIPTYFKIVKKPTDLDTIGKHLQAGEYNSAKDFHAEVKLMFANCYKFNPGEDVIHQTGKKFEELFDKLWAEKDEWMSQHVRSERESPEEEDESEEEAQSEPENDAMKRMLEIQQQIAALSQEAMNLSTINKPAPAARGKASSPKAGGKKAKGVKGSGAPKAKRANSSLVPPPANKPLKVKKPKHKKLTLEQKRYVSEGIAELDAGQMQKAVQIIRNGVPALRDVQDDELELDIDEIPDPVVFDLYQFVRKLRPKEDNHQDEDDDYEEDPYTAKTSKAGNRKKNKPMSAREQESKIAQVQKQLQRFQNGSGSEAQSPEVHHEESSDDDQSESSEEE